MNPIAAQRQEAIAGAINPIQAQIDALRASVPAQQNIDIDALKKSIMDEINAQKTPVSTTPAQIPAHVGPSISEAAGFNPYSNDFSRYMSGLGDFGL